MSLSKTGLKKKTTGASRSIKDVQKTERGLSARTSKQNELRSKLEDSAEDIIDLMTSVILTGELEGDKVANGMRLDLMKAYMPYVVPTLKSVEYVDQRPKDLQPLIINMHGGTASIDTDGDGSTHIEIEGSNEPTRDIRKDFIDASANQEHASKLDNLVAHKMEQGEDNGNPEVPQVYMKQTNANEAVVFENEGDLQALLKEATSLANRKAKGIKTT